MKTFSKKKGFTIVELVIVVAVIGILTAILVPTFVNLTNKANKAADESLVKNLNTQLRLKETTEGKNKNLTEALKDAREIGYLVENLKPKGDQDILWNQEADEFVFGDQATGELYKYWKMYDKAEDVPAAQTYSVYAKGTEWSGDLSFTVGFDAGENMNIASVSYKRNTGTKQSVILRTNGGKITVDAKNDEVKRFQDAETVNVIDIATASYHEYGTVKFFEVAAGHIVFEKDAKVNAVHFTATGEGDDAKFQNEDGKTISIDLSNVAEEAIPSFSRDPVIIDQNGTFVAEVTNKSTEYLWLFGSGIKEQMVSTTTEGAIAEAGVLKSGVSIGAEEGSIAEQIANPAKRNADGELIDEDNNAIDLSDVDLTKADALDATDVVVEEVASKEDVETGSIMFDGGSGSEIDPFIIADYDMFQNISNLYEAGTYSFKIKDGITALDLNGWTPVKLNGNFDGNGVILNNLDQDLFERVNGESVLIQNFTINANVFSSSGVGAVVGNSKTLKLTIDSVDVHGTLVGATWVTPYVCFGPGATSTWNLTIKNSISDAKLVAISGAASGFVGHPYNKMSQGDMTDGSLITIIDSAYIGNMSATGAVTGSNFKYFTINGNNNKVKTHYSDSFIEALGFNPEGTLYKAPADAAGYPVAVDEDGSKTFFAGNYGKNVADNYKPTDKKVVLNTTPQTTLPANIGDAFTITKVTGATRAAVSLQIAPNDSNNYGSYLGTYMTEEIDLSAVTGSTFASEEVKYFAININSGVTAKTGLSGNIFNVVNPAYGKNAHNGAWVKIVQFDANGNVLNITSVQIAAPHAAE